MCVGRAAAPPVVSGNIQVHSTAWKSLGTTPDTVQRWIENGVSIPFREGPPQPFCLPNPAFTNKQSEFISQEIADLLRAGAIVQYRIVLYVDDFLLCATPEDINQHSAVLLQTLSRLGLQVNWEKSSLEPAYAKEYIGYLLNTDGVNGHVWISIPKSRIHALRHSIKSALGKGFVAARGLAHIAGKCVSMARAILPAKLMLRNVYRLLKQRQSWQDILLLDTGTITDLSWWSTALSSWNGCTVHPSTIQAQLTTDASSIGWGGVVGSQEARGRWNTRLSNESSNHREMMAVLLSMQAFARQLKNKSVQIVSDNISTVAYINFQGGPSKDLSRIATAIWATAVDLNMTITAKFLAGSLNTHADFLSRILSHHDWRLNPNLFHYLDNTWGPHDVDRFASLVTTQLPRYNSLYADPMTAGVDALAQQDWGLLNNYVCPPFRLLHRVLETVQSQGAVATVIAPCWPAQSWFRTLQRLSIAPPIRLPHTSAAFLSMGTLPEPLRNPRWRVYAWRICGRRDSRI